MAAGTIPSEIPYLRLRQEFQMARSLSEVTRLSGDVYSYATASVTERFWGHRIADVFPKAEGELFPGSVVLLLAFVLIRAASFHHVDALIKSTLAGVRWNAIMELGGIGLTALGAVIAMRWRARPMASRV